MRLDSECWKIIQTTIFRLCLFHWDYFNSFCGLGESPLTERELNLAELVLDKWKCYQSTSLRVGNYTSRRLINFRSPVCTKFSLFKCSNENGEAVTNWLDFAVVRVNISKFLSKRNLCSCIFLGVSWRLVLKRKYWLKKWHCIIQGVFRNMILMAIFTISR